MKFVHKINYFFIYSLYISFCFSMAHANSWSGNFKLFPIIKKFPSSSDVQKSILSKAQIQLNTDLPLESKFEMAYEITTETTKQIPHQNNRISYRYLDLKTYLHDEKASQHHTTTIAQNLNRLNLNFTTSWGDISIGRMPLAFGVAKSISPNDVLSPLAFNNIDKEERTGIDTLLVKKSINENWQIDLGYVAGEKLNSEKSAYFIRPRFSFQKLDLNFTLLNFKQKKLLGIEVQHPFEDAGLWLDMAFVDNNQKHYKDFLRGTTGIDYKFKSSLYLALEYHYNGASLSNNQIYPEEFIFLRKRHYAIITSSYEISPLLIASLQNYTELKKGSPFTSLKLDYNLTDNSYLGLGCFLGLGDAHQSEFGPLGKHYYSSFRYYF